MTFTLDAEATQALIDRVKAHTPSLDAEFFAAPYTQESFKAAQEVVRFLGAHVSEHGYAEIGFWLPELYEMNVPDDDIYLELLTPPADFDITEPNQRITFKRDTLQLVRVGEFYFGVVHGMTAGTREHAGTFYRVMYKDPESGEWKPRFDTMAYSVPYGCFAPSEYYDIKRMQNARKDKDHFRHQLDIQSGDDDIPVVQEPVNILQIHVASASEERTFAGLTRIYRTISEKIERGEALTPAEQAYTGYDAVQLMPIEPTIEYESRTVWFWETVEASDDSVTVDLNTPDMTNWGYDVLIAGSAAPNPVLLGSKRPDELVELIATLHNFPGKPIKVMFDIVYGHTDNTALPLMNRVFFAGANMYGQNLNYLHPIVRASLLEMQRRKHDYGLDGVRVDGAQDFKNWDPETDTMWHDDDYLQSMSDIKQHVAGVTYRPWMIFEDGRPWPRDDWELTSTYREVTKNQPDIWQWGPLTFAHNTPFLFTFWISKWWRIREICDVGGRWITGVANHDTLRRGTQVDPESRINTYLGDTLPEIFRNAYDNAAANLFAYAIMPGIPMDFINASLRAPWSFVRNTDDRWGVKVVSEEKNLLDWVMNKDRFSNPQTLSRLKALGFETLGGLKRFAKSLDAAVKVTDYELDAMAKMMNALEPKLEGPGLSRDMLKQIARAWMDDMADYCNVTLYEDELDPERVKFNLAVREFRRARPWLGDDLHPDDTFDYVYPTDGSIVFYGHRTSPDGKEQVLFVANMEGRPAQITPLDLPIDGIASSNWRVALVSPGAESGDVDEALTLRDSQGIVWTRAL